MKRLVITEVIGGFDNDDDLRKAIFRFYTKVDVLEDLGYHFIPLSDCDEYFVKGADYHENSQYLATDTIIDGQFKGRIITAMEKS